MPHAHELMRTDFIIADTSDTATYLIAQMQKHHQKEAIVRENGKYLGVASQKWLLSSRIDSKKMKISNIIKHRSKSKAPFFVPKLKPDTDLKEITRLMTTADIHTLPVLDKTKVIGIVQAIDVVDALRQYYKGVKAGELATTKLITIKENEKLSAAINIMVKEGIGHIVVVDKTNKLAGVMSLTDILSETQVFPRENVRISRAASHQGAKRKGYGTGEKTSQMNLPVSNALTSVPNCCIASLNTPMSAIIDMIVSRRVASVVLTKQDTPIGIVTIKDILEDFSKA